MQPMRLSELQGCSPDGSVRVSSGVGDCVNLRFNGRTLEAVGTPRTLLYTEGAPLLADSMNGHKFLFTQGDDGTIYYQRLTDDEVVLPLPARELGRVEQAVRQAVSVGGFIIMLLADSTLAYARRDVEGDSYQWLGALPSLPSFTLKAEQGAEVSAGMEAVKFAQALTDLSGGVPEQVAGRVAAAWHDARARLVEGLRTAGQWTAPVDVSLALRLWDGTLLQVSEPVRLSPLTVPGSGRLNLGLLWDEAKKHFTGTDSATLRGRGFTISVEMAGSLDAAWGGLVQGIEVWVSSEPVTIDPDVAPRFAYTATTSGNYLTVSPVVRSSGAVAADVEAAPTGRLGILPPGVAQARLTYVPAVVYDSALEAFVDGMPGTEALPARCILAHDGFLHVACGESLYTSLPGNPLVVASHTGGLGAPVCSLMAQITGGGAYTRQYVYVATERGIVALTHRPDGTHTNARGVCAEPLGSEPVWCATPQGVYALTCTGSLVRLRDAKAPTLMGCLEGIRSMLWSYAWGELWLCGQTHSLVVAPVREGAAYRRTLSLTLLPSASAPTLAWQQDSLGRVSILDIEQELPQAGRALHTVCVELPVGKDSCARAADLYVGGSALTWRIKDCCGRVLGELRDVSPSLPYLRMPLPRIMPHEATRRARSRLYMAVEGQIEELSELTVYIR